MLIENHGDLTFIIIPKNYNFSGEYVVTSIKSTPNLKKLEFRNKKSNLSVIKPLLRYHDENNSIMFLNGTYETEMVLQIPLKYHKNLKSNLITILKSQLKKYNRDFYSNRPN